MANIILEKPAEALAFELEDLAVEIAEDGRVRMIYKVLLSPIERPFKPIVKILYRNPNLLFHG